MFAPIRTLSPTEQLSILQQVIDKHITIYDVKKVAGDLKKINSLKAAFIKLTNAESWDNAEATYPSFASEAQLKDSWVPT